MMNQDSSSTVTNTVANQPKLATVCGQCGIEELKLLHNIRLRGNYRRLCTTCVLRLHPQFFCPTCLGVFERSPPEDSVVCFKCYSSSHPGCVSLPAPGSVSSVRGPSPCASCLNPNSLKFSLPKAENGNRAIDLNAARLLLAAAKIASMSMNKAEAAAANEAERRSKEAAYTKKRAREALDHVAKLMSKQTINNNNASGSSSNNNRNNGVRVNNPNVVSNNNNVKADASSEVLEALNAVELKENDVVGMEVDGGHGTDLGGVPAAENGSVRSADLVNGGDNGENGHEQGLEKVNGMEGPSGVSNPEH